MTLPSTPKKRIYRKHEHLSQEELNELFVKAGWIGKRRERPVYIKSILRDDRGPGFGDSKGVN